MFSPNFFVMSDVWSISCIGLMCQRCARMFVRVWIRQKVSCVLHLYDSHGVIQCQKNRTTICARASDIMFIILGCSMDVNSFSCFHFSVFKWNPLRMELCTISWNQDWQPEIKKGGMTSAVLSYICIKPAPFSVKDAWTMAIIRQPGLTHVSCATPISVATASNMK